MTVARSDPGPGRFIAALVRIGRSTDTAILRTLAAGPRRYNEIAAEHALVADDELGDVLRELDAGGLIARRVDSGPPLRVLYELTPLGVELAPALQIVADWAHQDP